MPKTVDVCGTEVSLDLKSDYSEGILSDSVDSKSLLENLVRNNRECTGFLMWFSVFCTTCIFKTTKRSKYVYSLLLFNESQLPLIEYTKTVNSTASLVVAISNIKKLHNAGGYYKIKFRTCSAKAVVKAERKRIMKNERQKQDYEAMEPSKKRMLIEKKLVRDTPNKLELQKKQAKQYETMDSAKKQHLNKQAGKYKTMDVAKKQDL